MDWTRPITLLIQLTVARIVYTKYRNVIPTAIHDCFTFQANKHKQSANKTEHNAQYEALWSSIVPIR